MQIDVPVHLIPKLKKLLDTLCEAKEEMGDTEYLDIYFDTQDSGDNNSDPVVFKHFTARTFDLAREIKSILRM
jgi:hypothetical protein